MLIPMFMPVLLTFWLTFAVSVLVRSSVLCLCLCHLLFGLRLLCLKLSAFPCYACAWIVHSSIFVCYICICLSLHVSVSRLFAYLSSTPILVLKLSAPLFLDCSFISRPFFCFLSTPLSFIRSFVSYLLFHLLFVFLYFTYACVVRFMICVYCAYANWCVYVVCSSIYVCLVVCLWVVCFFIY